MYTCVQYTCTLLIRQKGGVGVLISDGVYIWVQIRRYSSWNFDGGGGVLLSGTYLASTYARLRAFMVLSPNRVFRLICQFILLPRCCYFCHHVPSLTLPQLFIIEEVFCFVFNLLLLFVQISCGCPAPMSMTYIITHGTEGMICHDARLVPCVTVFQTWYTPGCR